MRSKKMLLTQSSKAMVWRRRGEGGRSGVVGNPSKDDSSARLKKMLRVALKSLNQHRPRWKRELADDEGRTSNEDFYRGCSRDERTKKDVDTFELSYAYDLYTIRPKAKDPSAKEPNVENRIHASINTLDELIEYYVIEYLDIGDCKIKGLYMVERTPTDHIQHDAANQCQNTTLITCTPVAGGLTVEYNDDIVSKVELESRILDAIEYGMENEKLLPQRSDIRGVVFMGPEHKTFDSSAEPSLSSSSSSSLLSSSSGGSTSAAGKALSALIGGIVSFTGLVLAVFIFRRNKGGKSITKQWSMPDDDRPSNNVSIIEVEEEEEREEDDDNIEFV